MRTVEKKAHELQVGDVVHAKGSTRIFKILATQPSMGGPRFPYLTLDCGGKTMEHDTSFDSLNATYTVEVPETPEPEREVLPR